MDQAEKLQFLFQRFTYKTGEDMSHSPMDAVKCWTEAGISVCAQMGKFVHLVNTKPNKVYFRGHRLEPMETFFSVERHVVAGIFNLDAGGTILSVRSSTVLPPQESHGPGAKGRYINLNGRRR